MSVKVLGSPDQIRTAGAAPGSSPASAPRFVLRVIVLHAATYFAAGIVAASAIDYANLFEQPVIRDYMVPFGSVSVFLGPLVQLLRGLVLGLVLLPFRGILGRSKGWLWLWLLLVGVGIISTSAAAPSSIEGLVYTQFPVWYHLIGLPEMLVQTLVFSVLLFLTERYPAGVVAAMPPVARRIVRGLVVACIAFAAYAVISVTFAILAGVKIDAAESLDPRVQGVFVAPLLINGALAVALARMPRSTRISLAAGAVSYLLSVVAIFSYQAAVVGEPSLLYATIAPVLPAIIVGLMTPPRTVGGRVAYSGALVGKT
jgi:hypothetical protein